MTKFESLLKNKYAQFAVLALIFCALSACLQYENIWDLVNYHYYAGFSFLTGRTGYDLAPSIHHSFLNPLPDVPTYVLMRALNAYPAVYYAVAGLPAAVCVFVFLRICLLFFDFSTKGGKALTAAALAVGATGYGFFFQIGSSTHEIAIAAFVLTAFYFLLKALFFNENGRDFRFLLLSGFLFGAAAGLKINAAMYCVSSGVCVLAFYKKLRRPVRQIACFAAGGLTGFALTAGYWAYKMHALYQNPFPPLYNTIFKSPYFENFNYTDTVFSVGRSFWDVLTLPFAFIGYSGGDKTELSAFTEFRWAIAFVVLAAIVAARLFKRKAPQASPAAFATLFCLLSYALWAYALPVMRYTVPFEMLTGLLLVVAWRDCLPDGYFKTMTGAFALAACLFVVFISKPQWASLPKEKVLDFAPLDLPDDTLLFFVGDPLSAYFVPEAESKNVRAVTVSALTPLAFRMTETGEFANERAKIVKEHRGGHAALVRSEFFNMWEMPRMAWEIVDQSDCRPYRQPVYTNRIFLCRPAASNQYVFQDLE